MNAISEWLRHAISFRNQTIRRMRALEEGMALERERALEEECRCFCEPGEPSHDIADHLA